MNCSLSCRRYLESGSIANLTQGAFPTDAYSLLQLNTLRYAYIEQKPKRNYVMQWNMNIQREVTKDLTLRAGYIGSHGMHHPFRADDVNTVEPTLSGIFQASTGLPFTATIGGDPLGLKSADVYAFPDRLNTAGCGNSVNPGNALHYIKTECFAAPSSCTLLGKGGRNTLAGPGLTNFDMSLVKNTRITRISETFNVQFRAEFFNIMNHANFQVSVPGNRQIASTGCPRFHRRSRATIRHRQA